MCIRDSNSIIISAGLVNNHDECANDVNLQSAEIGHTYAGAAALDADVICNGVVGNIRLHSDQIGCVVSCPV